LRDLGDATPERLPTLRLARHEVSDFNRYPLKWHGDPDEARFTEWLVHGLLPKVGKALLVGQWGTYKTFVALDLARAVMTKTSFAGRSVHRQGGVLLIAAEGHSEVRLRLEGIAQGKVATLQAADDAEAIRPTWMPLAWIEGCPPLTAKDASVRLRSIMLEAVSGMRVRFGLPIALVIIDALMPAAGFKDADDASEAQRVMNVLTRVAMENELLVLIVDHLGKDVTTGTRYSSVKEDAADAVLALLGERSVAGTVSNPRLTTRKLRGGPTGVETRLSTRRVEILEEEGLEPATTLVIEWDVNSTSQAGAPESTAAKRWPRSLIIFNKALNYALASSGKRLRPFHDGPEVLAVNRDAVRHEFLKIYPADKATAKTQAFRRCEKDAITAGLMAARDVGPVEDATTYFWSLERT
jgi:hypothetical protein